MPAKLPAYRQHKQSGQAIVTLPMGHGRRKDVMLGKFNSPRSRVRYERVIKKWKRWKRRRAAKFNRLRERSAALTVAELVAKYWTHVETYYCRADGTHTQEVDGIRYSLRALVHLEGETAVDDVGAAALKEVRELMIAGYEHPKYGNQVALARSTINQRVKRIRRMFKWGVENDLVKPSTLQRLQSVPPLKRGRTGAKESPSVKPVARAVVEDTLPILRPMIRDMVMLQLETGMRPGELVAIRAVDIDRSGAIWLFRPSQHKTLHHGHERTIAIGPRGQEIIKRHLAIDTQAFLFSPAAMMEQRRAAMRANRKSKVQSSQTSRAKRQPKKRPGACYTVGSYDRVIAEAIKRHNEGKPEREHIPHWHPNQLRHLRALELKRQFGLDVARAVLGHRQPCITKHYAGVDQATAAEVMGKIG